MKTRPPWFYRQSAVIPFRVAEGEAQVLLINSRRRKRWIVPKGIVEHGLSAEESACKEAYEEAGVRGRVSSAPVGEYRYEKWGGVCTVQVFTLEVEEELDSWPEKSFRERRWMTVEDAARTVEESELQKLILTVQDVKT